MAKRFISAATRARRIRKKGRAIREVETPGIRKSRIDAVVDHIRNSPSPVRDQRRDTHKINTSARRRIVNNNEIGAAILRIVEVIGQDKLEALDEDTLYFIVSALNQLDIDYIRNKILLKVLPLKV